MSIPRPIYLRIRVVVERVGVILLSPLLLPFFGLVALAIRLDSPGPILFRQERAGVDETTFEIIKFRTMYHRTEGSYLTEPNDDRVTRIGRILRPLHLDELPQLWNIMRGEMSLVGPRPEPLWHVEECERRYPEYHLRRRITPGLTGLAQVELDYIDSIDRAPEKLQHDIYYITNLSPVLDFHILIRTLRGKRGR